MSDPSPPVGDPVPPPAPGAVVPADAASGELDPATVDLVAAALRSDTSDLETYHKVLTDTVGELLPPGLVEIDRERSMKDRMAGREGKATSMRLLLGDRTLELTAAHGRLVATSAHTVRGVVISKQEISVAEWTRQLAQYLAQLAADSAASKAALAKLLGSG